ncbi:hypothetical protein A3D66_00840 [Candidatus Kaiserbacteria bacterium RIFCSPHIGHO2_02_FULL_50_9]|uniref:Uncharacterized protein n=1 Tax=Candidatus Kaiserbacteria bacterium RIFCSPLOWO2_01_FULL_51_21 TaxID=1798508 RepID=A0A1F6ECS5_9BACT|nr:MAG: hypothetical protein A2761_00935 [Candidatus Kaiserbacteria bacterium RIFCSPHIGHO2_01_FULL_51_33]OGG63472.1 MAG: hypothetical protein A3D66_00840 [Candidatus Kaiserbacteria bacterium RIFCSPHIGHO2_02_FULL_50_9]OGG71464.1 MAG: hypothetical protein A3A35_03415 [Candidatus Kaiserbacteria bacterium RIFCSPLOWO2_01_FULL_51_21]
MKRVALYLFVFCLFACATLVLVFIWAGGPSSPLLFQVAASLFVVGLTSFLVWSLTTFFELRDKIANHS